MEKQKFLTILTFLFLSSGKTQSQTTNSFDFASYLKSSLQVLSDGESISEACQTNLTNWLDQIKKGEIWALRMMDSISKIPDGLLMGRFQIPGHFDECVQVRTEEFKGKHCTLKFNTVLGNPYQILHNRQFEVNVTYEYGICVPSTCSAADLNQVMQNITQFQVFNVPALQPLSLQNVTDNDCSTDEFRSMRTEDWIAVSVILFVLLLALASTTYDVGQKMGFVKNVKANQLLCSFSLYTNTKSLFKISRNSAQLRCLHGIRFLSMTWVVLGHAYITMGLAAPLNLMQGFEYLQDKSFFPINNGFVSVDTFFFLSGLLVCLVFFRDIDKKKTFDVPGAFIHRYIRLTPPLAMMMFLQATVITRIGNGPFWNKNMDKAESDCRGSWWAGLLYVQNFVSPTTLCLGQSWYLSADMQMFWLSPLILYPMLFWPIYAPYFLIFLLLAAITANFAIGFANELQPNLGLGLQQNPLKQFEIEYIKFYARMSPWLIGLATGYLICGIHAKKIRLNLSKASIIVGWIIGLGLIAGSITGIIRFMSYEYSFLESAFYLTFHRVGWALGLSWIVIACVSGYGGPINFILSLDIFQPLGKLSYCNFLIHMSFQSYRLFSMRVNQYIRHFDVVHLFCGDLVMSFTLAIPLMLLFEMPFVHIDRFFFQNFDVLPFPRKSKGAEKEEKNKSKSNLDKNLEMGQKNSSFQGYENC